MNDELSFDASNGESELEQFYNLGFLQTLFLIIFDFELISDETSNENNAIFDDKNLDLYGK